MPNIRSNRYRDEHFRLLGSCTRNAGCCREAAWKEADGRQWVCYDKEKYFSFTHPLSFLISHSSFSHCSVWALHMFWPHLFSMCLFFHAIFLLYIVFGLSVFHFFPSILLCIPIAFSPCFSFPSASYTLSLQPPYFVTLAVISTFSRAACKGQVVGCNHPGYIQIGAGLQLLETLKPWHPPGTPWL